MEYFIKTHNGSFLSIERNGNYELIGVESEDDERVMNQAREEAESLGYKVVS
jgi:hypothetical protein